MQRQYTNYPSLADRSLLVSGGGSGIGASIVTSLAHMGAKVGFLDIDDGSSQSLCEALDKPEVAHKPLYRAVDITDLDALGAAISEIAEENGPIQGLVNNAANDTRHSISEVTPEFWQCSMQVNLDHQFFASQAVAEGMKAAGCGSIVNMGSMSWRVGVENLSAYMTAKSAIEGLTNGLARDLGPHGIRVNCITPGFVRTDRQVKLWLTPELEQEVFANQCLKEFIQPEDIANMVGFLLAEDSRMCTSGVFPVNGGWI